MKSIIHKILRVVPDSIYLRLRYRQRLGKKLNLNNPKTFTEKIQWLKLHDRSKLHTDSADKITAKEIVKDKLGSNYVIPILFQSDKVDDFRIDNLPNKPFVLKTNHDSGGVKVFHSNKVNYKEERKQLKNKLQRNFYWPNREWEYRNIKAKWFIEPLLTDQSGNTVLNDYKIHCFNGTPTFIQTIFDRNEGVKENWFDIEWNSLDIFYFSSNKKTIAKPIALDRMLEISMKLSEPYKYVRIDLYEISGDIYFGEFTFRPYGGFMKWNGKDVDNKLGQLINLK